MEEILTWSVLDVYFHISYKLGSPPMLDCRNKFCYLTFQKRWKWPYPNVFTLLFDMYLLFLLFFIIWSLHLRWIFEPILFKRGILFCKSIPLLRFLFQPPFWFRAKVSQPRCSLIMCNFQSYMPQTNAIQSEWKQSWKKILLQMRTSMCTKINQ